MKIAKAESIEAKEVALDGAKDVRMRMLISEADGAPNFRMRLFTLAPGGHTPLHEHDWEHEVYILAGSAAVATPDGDRPASEGDCLYIPPGEIHQFRNAGDDELKFLCLVPNTSP